MESKRLRFRLVPRFLQGIKGLAVLIGSVVTIAGAAGWLLDKARDASESPVEQEAKRLGKLRAGTTFGTFREVLADAPDLRLSVNQSIAESERLARFVFERPYAYVQAIVDRDGTGTVVAFTIVARHAGLDVTFEWADQRITIGRTTVVQAAGYPSRIGAICGAKHVQYFEVHGGSGAEAFREFAVGVHSAGFDRTKLAAVCGASVVGASVA